MSLQDNKELVYRRYEEIENQHLIAAVDELMTPDYVHHDPSIPPDMQHSRDGFKQLAAMFAAAVPDLHTTIHDLIAEGDMVAARLTSTGTHQGELMGIPPTGAHVEVTAIAIYRIDNGKLAEGWVNFDALGMLRKIGAIPP